jgi:hypothetical protein
MEVNIVAEQMGEDQMITLVENTIATPQVNIIGVDVLHAG